MYTFKIILTFLLYFLKYLVNKSIKFKNRKQKLYVPKFI